MMQTTLNPNVPIEQAIAVPQCDRWRIYHRLQELMISCSCPADGSLRVGVHYSIDLILVRSTVQQFTAPRHELVHWLERCWATTAVCKQNH